MHLPVVLSVLGLFPLSVPVEELVGTPVLGALSGQPGVTFESVSLVQHYQL